MVGCFALPTTHLLIEQDFSCSMGVAGSREQVVVPTSLRDSMLSAAFRGPTIVGPWLWWQVGERNSLGLALLPVSCLGLA